MSLFVNLAYHFDVPGADQLDGSVLVASGMPSHQLSRRKAFRPVTRRQKNPTLPDSHLVRRMFDPQLYLTGVDAHRAPSDCVTLASYPWFGISSPIYDSTEMNQSEWRKQQLATIGQRWTGRPPTGVEIVRDAVEACLEFQYQLGFNPLVAPAPLTIDLSSDLSTELLWLDAALSVRQARMPMTPMFATVAIADGCLAYMEPYSNPLLESLLDAISAREVDGVYLVVEQTSESGDTRHCGTARTVQSLLHLTKVWARDVGLRVMVNFLGPASLLCRAAGAETWATNWYKSNVRLRIADMYSTGRAFPSYWAHPVGTDIHILDELDALNRMGQLPSLADETDASRLLLEALRRGRSVSAVPDWAYTQSNVQKCSEHYLLSCVAADRALSAQELKDRVPYVEKWLNDAQAMIPRINAAEPDASKRKTRTSHLNAWRAALHDHVRFHGP